MKLFVLLGYSGPVATREMAMELLSSMSMGGLLRQVLFEYWLSFALSAIILVMAAVLRLDRSALSVPILLWALDTAGSHLNLFNQLFHPLWAIRSFIEALLALALVLLVVSIPIVSARLQPNSRSSLQLAFLAATTVILDWSLILLFITRLPD